YMIDILQTEAKSLRERSRELTAEEAISPKTKKLIATMKKALAEQDDGVAIAAPQVGENVRLFVMSGKVFELIGKQAPEGETFADMVFINPKITKLSKEKEEVEEGCLSVRYLYGKVRRSKKASIQALDEHGKKFLMGGSGIVAQI